MNIGFVGASGMMGHGMAKHLLLKGHALSLTIHQQTQRLQDLLAVGAQVSPSHAELAQGAELLFLCVTGSPEVEQVMLGPNGVLNGAQPGLIVIDCSTSEPQSSAMLRARCEAQSVVFVDAPLSRSPVESEAGLLNVMVGAEPDIFERIEPVLRCFAEHVWRVGGPGAGHTIKLLNNFIGQAICTATAEAFAVGQKAGVDLHQLVNVVGQGPVNSGLFQAMAKTLDGQLDGLRFALNNARKDVRYYTHLAESHQVPAMVGSAVHQAISLASALGYGQDHVPALVLAQEKVAGVKLATRGSS